MSAREEIVMRFWRGESMQDLAWSLGMSVGDVEAVVRQYMRQHRGKQTEARAGAKETP